MPEPHYADELVTLHHGDCLDVLLDLPDDSVDAVITDPPYGLGFMGKAWDADFTPADVPMRRSAALDAVNAGAARQGGRQRAGLDYQRRMARDSRDFGAWCETWATDCLRILKPGGHLLAFGGSRTWHRLAAGIEDAGFELRDSIAWLYGSGFPKSLDVSKALDKREGHWRGRAGEVTSTNGSMENPNRERTDKGNPVTPAAAAAAGWGTALKPAFEPIVVGRKPLSGTVADNWLTHGTGALNIDGCRTGTDGGTAGAGVGPQGDVYGDGLNGAFGKPVPGLGRWPTNVVLDDSQADALDAQTGILTSGANPTRRGSDKFRDAYGDFAGQEECTPARGADSGGASRFFPTFRYEAKAPTVERPRDGDVAHPTVKPLDLMRWLVRLVTPPGGTVLEPFAGSGTTAEACVIEGFQCIAIEREASYLPLIVARLTKPIQPDLFGGAA